MLVLRCTTKAFRKVGGKPQAVEISHPEPTLGDWYVNTVDYLNGGDLLVACMHDPSLYILLVPIRPKLDAEGLVSDFCTHLLTRLIELETPPDAAQHVLAAYQEGAVLAKTTSRKVLGHLNAALREMEFVLDAPDNFVNEGNRLIVPKIEHRLNTTPRGSGKNCIWPLREFWNCLRSLCHELPPRLPLSFWTYPSSEILDSIGDAFGECLPLPLASKLHATLKQVDVLFAAEELETLRKAIRKVASSRHCVPSKLLEDLHRQVRIRLDRLQKD
jgi:hypothetical protein